MELLRAVAEFPHITPGNLAGFKQKAIQLLENVSKQETVLRYDLFFNADSSRCVILEEYQSPEAVIEHVKTNASLLAELSILGGKIEGSMFPSTQIGAAITEIREHWDSKMHYHFAGK